jgi:hypothetical protein
MPWDVFSKTVPIVGLTKSLKVELQLLQVNDKLPEKVFELLLGTQP